MYCEIISMVNFNSTCSFSYCGKETERGRILNFSLFVSLMSIEPGITETKSKHY